MCNWNMDVYSIPEGPRDSSMVLIDMVLTTGTFFGWVIVVSAGAGVHCGDEREMGRKL